MYFKSSVSSVGTDEAGRRRVACRRFASKGNSLALFFSFSGHHLNNNHSRFKTSVSVFVAPDFCLCICGSFHVQSGRMLIKLLIALSALVFFKTIVAKVIYLRTRGMSPPLSLGRINA